jgi:hypothetical protein
LEFEEFDGTEKLKLLNPPHLNCSWKNARINAFKEMRVEVR